MPPPFPDLAPLIEEAIAPYKPAAMFDLREHGYGTLYHQLISCLISVRTLDEISLPAALRVFEIAPDWQTLANLPLPELAKALEPAQFAGQKAGTFIRLAQQVLDTHKGNLPATYEALIALHGVGPKCANLTLGIAAGIPAISVDTHVFRVVNRLGVVHTATAEKTVAPLEAWVPKELWINVNRLLMPFGKHICVFGRPKCELCPLTQWCDYYNQKIKPKIMGL